MIIDFEKLGIGNVVDTSIHPREIFGALPAKSAGLQYLRDVQTEVINQWFIRRDERDLVIKMNTGSGKTILGLLLLKSCLNEGKGPAVYVAPDKYLVNQVINEAKRLGISVTDEPSSLRFQKGQDILVIHTHVLFNGKSTFGVNGVIRKQIGSIVVDDAHACISTTVGQFTLTIKNTNQLYKDLLTIFADDLATQSETGIVEIMCGYPNKNMLVPYWSWANKQSQITKLLLKDKDSDDVVFAWPLLREYLHLCQCVVSSECVEISTRCLPVDSIPSFTNAKRRIYMTATLSDDSVLVTDFDANPKSVINPISPSTANDIGDRLILVPQELNPDTTEVALKTFFKNASAYFNVVVIVPSFNRAKFWEDVAVMTLSASNLHDGVDQLKSNPKLGLVVLVNKYDGIDLPNDACRLLVIDGQPDVRREIDKINQSVLSGSEELSSQYIQKIEQGMGRGIRSNEDYCVVILMGASLTGHLYAHGAIEKFTSATKAQIALSGKVSDQLHGKSLKDIADVIKMFMSRDSKWVSASKGMLVQLTYDKTGLIKDTSLAQRSAYDAAQRKDFGEAIAIMEQITNATEDKKLKGWLKQQLAEYMYFVDPVKSQETLKSGLKFNKYITKPLEGITYSKLVTDAMDQATLCSEFLSSYATNPNNLILYLNELYEDFIFLPDTASRFEEATKKLSKFLGFVGQRPENEFSKGPDVLWGVGKQQFFVIECKNGAIVEKISKHDCNQLGGSVNWFTDKYDHTCTCTPILIHVSRKFEHAATPHAQTVIMQKVNLDEFKSAMMAFVKSIVSSSDYSVTNVAKQLKYFKLTPAELITQYTKSALTS